MSGLDSCNKNKKNVSDGIIYRFTYDITYMDMAGVKQGDHTPTHEPYLPLLPSRKTTALWL